MMGELFLVFDMNTSTSTETARKARVTNRRWTTAVCAEIMEVVCGNTHGLASAVRGGFRKGFETPRAEAAELLGDAGRHDDRGSEGVYQDSVKQVISVFKHKMRGPAARR